MGSRDKYRQTRRVLVNVLNITDDQLAGAAVFTRNLLAEWLVKDDQAEVVILHSAKVDARKLLQLPNKSNVKTRSAFVTGFVSRIMYEQLILPWIVRSFDAYYSPTQILPFASVFISRNVKLITTVHDMIPFFVESKYGYLRMLYVKLISRWGPVFSDIVVVVSMNTLNDVVSITKIPPSKIHVIYNFLVTPFRKDNWEDNKFFVCISTVEPGKNIENTLAGFARFIEKYNVQDYSFYWLGKIGWGYTKEQLNEKITSLGLQDKFQLLGFVPETIKQEMLNNCTALIYLSHYEGFGIPVLEGLYHNKPALVSRSSSLPEVIGDAGILCDHLNPEEIAMGMHRLISNLEHYRSSIPDQIAKFEKDAQIKKFMSIIHG